MPIVRIPPVSLRPRIVAATPQRAEERARAIRRAIRALTRRAARFIGIALASALPLIAPPLHAASGYDLTDLWGAPAKPGWGIQLVQQRDVIFATLFVYDAARQPAWYSATLEFQGLTPQTHTLNYGGVLYRTTGPWYGGGTASIPQASRSAGRHDEGHRPDDVHRDARVRHRRRAGGDADRAPRVPVRRLQRHVHRRADAEHGALRQSGRQRHDDAGHHAAVLPSRAPRCRWC